MTSVTRRGSGAGGRTRVAIVGGGPSALAAAFHLCRNEPDDYEITLFEMSWRLGGKTASGRAEYARIEEHGLHVLFGCYHNVFHTMRVCYDELRSNGVFAAHGHRLEYFFDAIAPHHFGVIGDDRKRPWEPMYLQFPSNRGVPGDPPLPSSWDLTITIVQILWMIVLGPDSLCYLQRGLPWLFDYGNRWKRRDPREPWEERHRIHPDGRHLGGDIVSRALIKGALGLLDGGRRSGRATSRILARAQRAWRGLEGRHSRLFARPWTSGDFVLAFLRGLVDDGVLSQRGGFERADREDFRVWLARHGASQHTLSSPWMRVIYDAAFSYPQGGKFPEGADAEPPPPGLDTRGAYELIAAGSAIRALLLMTVTYKGAFYNKMEAGMGDVICTPLYLYLRGRGVRFEFFHRLVDATAGTDAEGRPSVESLVFDTLPLQTDYDPLIGVNGLACWPAQPKLDTLPEECRERARHAESYCPEGASGRRRTLSRTRGDFDLVVLGIPVACLPYACPSLLAAELARPDAPSPSLADQARIDTVQTIALQYWLKPTLTELGWSRDSPLLSLFVDPINTWCDMSHLVDRECWPRALRPGTIAYFCGVFPHDHDFPPPHALGCTPAVRAAVEARALQMSREFTERELEALMPAAADANGFNYNLLVDPQNRKGAERFATVYVRANYEPHALCTLALPGKTRYRMKTERTGFENLFVTGDWIDNGVLLACVEGAFHSGIRTARAIAARVTGHPEKYPIIAEDLLNLRVLSPQARSTEE